MTQELFEYGVHTEKSDIRAHVSVVNRCVYVFPTFQGVRAVEDHGPPRAKVFQPGVNGATADGWLVRVEWIQDLRRRPFYSWPRWGDFSEGLSTTEKGRLAVSCVAEIMRLGRFPLWIDAQEDGRGDMQLEGTDILVFCRKKIQVKCDYRGGDVPLGTGNLFLQRAERNPLRRF